MANTPDLSTYHDLKLFDRDPQAVFDAALQNLRTRLPDWEPREDATEIILMEAMALEVSEAIFAINRLPGSIMSILMQKYGIFRDEGAYPTAVVNLQAVNTFGYTVDAGTRFLLELGVGIEPVVFTVTESRLIPNGSGSVNVVAVGSRYTAAANGTPSGTRVEMLDPMTFIENATLAEPVYGGREPENDMEWAARGSARLRRLSDVLVTPEHFELTALEEPGVVRAHAVDMYNPGGTNPEDSPGHISVAVYTETGTMNPTVAEALRAKLAAKAVANLEVHIIEPTITTLDIGVTVHRHIGYTDEAVRSGIISALDTYLDPQLWPWSGVVRVNELISLVDRVPGVDYVASIDNPVGDRALGGHAPLVDLGEVTVNFV